MSGYGMLAVALLLGGLAPVVALGAVGHALSRLVALELASSLIALFMLVFVEVSDETYELILPLVLVPLSLAGTLVFTRLLRGMDS